MDIINFFIDIFDLYNAQFQNAFNNIPNQNFLSTLYLILNFFLLTVVPFFTGSDS